MLKEAHKLFLNVAQKCCCIEGDENSSSGEFYSNYSNKNYDTLFL